MSFEDANVTIKIRQAAFADGAVGILRSYVDRVLDAYKQRVLAAALEVKDNENWCDQGFAEAMRGLDIPLPEREYEVEISVTAYQTVTAKVMASSADEANDKADRLTPSDVMELARPDRWNHDGHDVDEVLS